ncbi:MAG TPA: VWA domain-containing protein, partial [Pyrinomonadaceae bacterium]|nr:VWA domain-containing protein [Pyrinomonadaceae bacterium]
MASPRKYSSTLLAATVLLLSALSLPAQEKGEAEEVRPNPPEVRLNVIVTDNANRPVTDLRAEEFRVLEDGKEQSIKYFSRDEVPVSYGVVVDASGSQRELLNEIIEAGRKIVGGNRPPDETFVMRFVDTDNIDVLQGLTSNKDALVEALDSIYIEGGLTAVNDAVDRAVEYLGKNGRAEKDATRRRAIVLITDGEDRGSRLRNPDLLLNRLREAGVQFFIIGLSKIGKLQSSREKAANLLTSMARETGGRVFFPNSRSEISGVADEITRDLRAQYVIGYAPTNRA